MIIDIKNLRIVDVTEYKPILEELGMLSSKIEYKIKNPSSKRKLIKEEEIYKQIRAIIDLVEKL